jgi:GTP-binding protein
MRAIKAIEEADVCILMIDAQKGIEAQDMSIFRMAQRRNKGILLLVNKWDLVEKETNTARDYEKELRQRIAPFSDVPILFISVLEKQRLFRAVEAALQVYENRSKKIKTSRLNEVMLEAIERYPPPSHRGRFVKIKYVTQLPTYYPAFAFFCNNPKHVKDNYKHYLENQLRQHFDFTGVPIGVFFRKK